MLEICGFKTIDPSAARVEGLRHYVTRERRRASDGRTARVLNDGVDEILVEVPGGNQAEGVYGMLNQDIYVIGCLRLKIGIAERNDVGIHCVVYCLSLRDILRVGAREPAAVSDAQIGAVGQSITQRSTRQNL